LALPAGRGALINPKASTLRPAGMRVEVILTSAIQYGIGENKELELIENQRNCSFLPTAPQLN
jgi:hypothetical protein